ncbi:MAG: Rid family detoxifying hydrolase, partial [Lysobacterales bacterium]
MSKEIIHTAKAPEAIGTYSQAVIHQGLVFLSGQIPLDPQSMEVVPGGIENQIRRVFENLSAVCTAAGGTLDDIVKLTVFLTDMSDFPQVNTIMGQYFAAPYP